MNISLIDVHVKIPPEQIGNWWQAAGLLDIQYDRSSDRAWKVARVSTRLHRAPDRSSKLIIARVDWLIGKVANDIGMGEVSQSL